MSQLSFSDVGYEAKAKRGIFPTELDSVALWVS